MPRGGFRPGSGNKKGVKLGPNASTITKAQARAAFTEMVIREMRELVAAQLEHAKGLKYLVTRDKKTGKFVRVTEAMAKLKSGTDEGLEDVEVWEKDPSVQAFTDLMNRALDKPTEYVDLEVSGGVNITDVLSKRHARHRQA